MGGLIMKMKPFFKRIILAILMPFSWACRTSCVGKTKEESTRQDLIGYIIDEHCFSKNPFRGSNSKTCLRMTDCAASGYGIAALQSDVSLKFFYFDGDFAPAATGGQLIAEQLINASAREEYILISVTGTITGEASRASDGRYFPMIHVFHMREREFN